MPKANKEGNSMRVETKGHLCRGWTHSLCLEQQLNFSVVCRNFPKALLQNLSSSIIFTCLILGQIITYVQPCNQVEFFKLCKLKKKKTASIIVWSLSCVRLCDRTDCSPARSPVHVILQGRILEWVAISFSRRSSQPRDQICISCSAGRFFTTEPPRRPPFMGTTSFNAYSNHKK